MTYMSRNPQVASVVLDDITTTTPSNPPSGKVKVVDRNGTLFVRNSSGAESAIGTNSSVGSGEKNYVENPSAAASISGWTNVGDLDVARTATAADLPRENTTKTGIKITADANTQSAADYVYYDFTLDDVDASGRIMKIKWDQKVTGTYTAGQLEVVITTQADRTTAVATPFTTAIPASDGTFQTYFLAPSTATCSLVIRATADMTTDGGIVISDVVVSPNVQVQGSAVTNETNDGAITFRGSSSNPTKGTIAVDNLWYSFAGDKVLFRGEYHHTVAGVAGSGNYYIVMPNVIPADSSKFSNTGANYVATVGYWAVSDATNGYGGVLTLFVTGGETRLYFDRTDGSTASWQSGSTVNFADTVLKVTFFGTYPTTASSSNVTLANRAVEEYSYNTSTSTTASDTSSFGYGPSGAQIQVITARLTRRVRFQTPIQSTDAICVEVSSDRSVWFELNGPVVINGDAVDNYKIQNTVRGGMGRITKVSSTDVDVDFAEYSILNGSTFGAAGLAWTNGGTGYWRVRKVSGGASVGYPISSANIVGRTDGVAPASGMVGERIAFTTRTVSCNTSTWTGSGANALATLTQGVWLIFASSYAASTASLTRSFFAVATDGDNDSTDFVCQSFSSGGGGSSTKESYVGYYNVTGSTQSIYAKGITEGASASLTTDGFAIRIA